MAPTANSNNGGLSTQRSADPEKKQAIRLAALEQQLIEKFPSFFDLRVTEVVREAFEDMGKPVLTLTVENELERMATWRLEDDVRFLAYEARTEEKQERLYEAWKKEDALDRLVDKLNMVNEHTIVED